MSLQPAPQDKPKIESKKDLEILVAHCSFLKLPTKESMQLLQREGYEISERTFFKYKKKLRRFMTDQITNLLENFILQHLVEINTLQKINRELWNLYKKSKDENFRLRTLESVRKNIIQLSQSHYDTVTAVGKHKGALSMLPLGKSLGFKGCIKESIKIEEEGVGIGMLTTPYIEGVRQERISKLKQKLKRKN